MRMTHRLAGLLAATLLVGAALAAGTKEEIEAHLRAGRWQQAEAELQQVLDKHPDNATAHYWLAQAQYRQGRTQEAAASRVCSNCGSVAKRWLGSSASERLAQQAAAQPVVMAPGYAGYGPVPSAGGPGVLGTVAAVGVGAAAGMLLAEAAEAASHTTRPGMPQPGYDAGPGIDLGGATGSAADWSAAGDSDGSLDLGSGGGDDFS